MPGGFKRWLSEIGKPERKCARVGHRMIDREYRAYIYPPIARWAVAERAWFKEPRCTRCGHTEEEQEISRTALDGLTMSADKWDLLKRDGRLVI